MTETDFLTDRHTFRLSEVRDDQLKNRLDAAINLMDNTNRGLVGEVLVAMALDGEVTDDWGDWDITLANGTRIEVKTTGRVQAWHQKAFAPARWTVGKSQGWVLTDDGYDVDETEARRSDAYVFALHTGVRPDDPDEWRFYVVATDRIDRELGNQKTISESSLMDHFDVSAITYQQLSKLNLKGE